MLEILLILLGSGNPAPTSPTTTTDTVQTSTTTISADDTGGEMIPIPIKK